MARAIVQAIKDDVVSKMVEELDKREKFVGLNKNQIRKILQGFKDDIINDVGRKRGGIATLPQVV